MNKRYYILLMMILSLSLFNCSKSEKIEEALIDPDPTTIKSKAPVITDIFSEIITGGIISVGNDDFEINESGVVWSENQNPTINDTKLVYGGNDNNFSLTIVELEESTTYYIRAYIYSNSDNVIYGNEVEVTSIEKPNPLAFLPSAGDNLEWKIQPNFSNEFDYSEGKASTEFTNNWKDSFFNGWTGARKTVYSASQSTITDGELVYTAKIDKDSQGNDIIKTGCVSTKTAVGYPLYMEARVKISESSLASAVWMLSDDSTQEIDNLEAYGERTHNYYSDRLHLSHHVFIRQPFQDYQPKGGETYYKDSKGTKWADDYHVYGVLWLDPWTLKYYVDGELVRETPKNQIDPNDYTSGTGLNKDMHLIISAASQPWRENQGINYLTDPSVLDSDRSTMRTDFIRVYKPE